LYNTEHDTPRNGLDMVKIGITYRLFLSILAATCLAILCMFIIMRWNIDRGFFQYLNSMAKDEAEFIKNNLERDYSEHGNWDFLRADPSYWIRYTAREQRSTPPDKVHPPKIPLIILDAEHKPLFGQPARHGEVDYTPILNNSRTVGYIGILPPRHFLSPHQFQFLRQQKLALIAAVLGLIFAVMTISLPLARRVVRPIKALAMATRELASGKYSVRVAVTSSDELGRLAQDFNSMAMTLEKNEKARRQWVADISHELRTPLAVLRGEIEALLEGVRDTTPDAIRSLHAEVVRLHRLVDDLHQLTLSDLGALTYRKEDLDPAGALGDSVRTHRAEFTRKGIKLTTDIPEECRYIFADGERLRQLFSNLFDNSLKYTDAGGELVVRLRCGGSHAAIDFEDSSPGVPPDDMDKLFDRLYRVDNSRSRSSGGAGLGLSICRNIVLAHEGTITAQPSSLGGLLIRIVIPFEEAGP